MTVIHTMFPRREATVEQDLPTRLTGEFRFVLHGIGLRLAA